MRFMSLKSNSPPPIESKRWSKALGETLLQPPAIILSLAAARTARSRSRKATRGGPGRICRNAEHPQEVLRSTPRGHAGPHAFRHQGFGGHQARGAVRSEEHTSELQSPMYLV